MTLNEERRMWRQIFGVALIILAVVFASLSLIGCATGTRKVLSTGTTAAEESVKVVDKLCLRWAKEWCKTDPCPKLEKCKSAYRHTLNGAASLTAGAKEANEVIP